MTIIIPERGERLMEEITIKPDDIADIKIRIRTPVTLYGEVVEPDPNERLKLLEDKYLYILETVQGYVERKLSDIDRQTTDVSAKIDNITRTVTDLTDVIRPDETDVHNINRRIDVLAQRVAKIESDNRSVWDRFRGQG